MLYAPRDRTSTRSTDTDGANRVITTILFHQDQQLICQHRHEVIYVRIIRSVKKVLSNYFATYVHNSVGRFVQTDIDANYPGLNLIHCLFSHFHNAHYCEKLCKDRK